MPDRQLYLNLPVRDLPAALRFFEHLGFAFDPRFTDQTAACMVVSPQTFVMLLAHERFDEFALRPLADARATTGLIVAVSATGRAEVDALADAALQAGARPAAAPIDHGFMYGRSFFDLDGHHWEVLWMREEIAGADEAATPAGAQA